MPSSVTPKPRQSSAHWVSLARPASRWPLLVTAWWVTACGAEAGSLTNETRCGDCSAQPTHVVEQSNDGRANSQSSQGVSEAAGHACSLLENIELSSPRVSFGDAEMVSLDLGAGVVTATTDFLGQELVMSVQIHNRSRQTKSIPQGVVLDCGERVRLWNGGVWMSSLSGGQSAIAEVIVQASPGDVRCTWSVTVDPDVPTNVVPECAASLDVALALESAR